MTPRVVLAFCLLAPLTAQWPAPVLDAPLVVLSNNSASMIEVLDHNGSGALSALAVRIERNPVTTWASAGFFNLQSGSLPAVLSGYQPTVGTMEPFSAVGQIGATDAAQEAVLGLGDRIHVLRSWNVTTLITTGAVRGVAIADLDGDGNGDVGVLRELAGARWIDAWRWNGTGLVLAASMQLPGNAGDLLLAAETDGDSQRELIVVGARVQCFELVAGSLMPGHDLLVGLPHPMPVAGDIDQDGDVDLVVFDMTTYSVLRRTGPNAFVVEAPVAGGPATHLHDVDGDGDLDGACCSGGGTSPLAMFSPMTFNVSINDNGLFRPAYTLHGIGGFHLAGVADVDGNGHKDLIAGRTIYFAQRSLGQPPQAGPSHLAAPRSVFDADGDGDVDVVTRPDECLINPGDGALAARSLQLLSPPPVGTTYGAPVVPGDFDGDGDQDLIVGVWNGNTPTSSRLLWQRGPALADGGEPFPSGTVLPAAIADEPTATLVTDFDADGALDLILNTTVGAPGATLWRNIGGSFVATPMAGFTVRAVADFTGDGRPDLIVSDGRLLLRRALPGGGFAAAELLTMASWHYFNAPGSVQPNTDGIAVADWNGDGLLDLVAGERSATGGCFPALLLGRGAQVPPFAPGLSNPVTGINPAFPTRILAGDVDGDGNVDCVLSNPFNATTNGCVVAFGTGGSPEFDLARQQQLLVPVTALADMDADGDLEMVGRSIARGAAFQGPTAGLRLQWGTGTAGVGGVVPVLGAGGRIAVGQALSVWAAGAQGGTCGLIAFGTQTWSVPVFGGTSYVNPLVSLTVCPSGVPGAAGDGRTELVLPPLSASLAGLQFYAHAAFLDSASVLTLTNALTLRVGQ